MYILRVVILYLLYTKYFGIKSNIKEKEQVENIHLFNSSYLTIIGKIK